MVWVLGRLRTFARHNLVKRIGSQSMNFQATILWLCDLGKLLNVSDG